MFFERITVQWLGQPSSKAEADTPGRSAHLYLTISLFCLLLLAPAALFRPLQMSDEGRYAEVARETLVSGDWVVPHMNGVPHLTKSAFYYDLVALSFKFFGFHPFAQRLVSILPFLLALLFTVRWAERRGGRGAAVLCTIASLTMIHPVGAGQFGDLNMLLTAFLTVGMLLLFDGLERPGRRAAWYLGWAFLGLAFLTKGPPALMIPGGTLLAYRLINGQPFRKPWTWWLGGGLVFCIFGLPWYLWLLITQGELLWSFWMTDIVERTSMSKSSKSFIYYFFYLPVFLGCSSGWGVLMAWWLGRAVGWRKRAEKGLSWWRAGLRALRALPAAEQWLLAWVVATLIVFSAIRAHMMTYIQPAYPAAALLLSLYLIRHRGDHRLARAFIITAQFAAAVTVLGVWGASFTQFAMVHLRTSNPSDNESIAYNTLVQKMKATAGNRNWSLAQCYFYNPSICFLTQRNAIMCEQEVHPGWPMPPALQVSRSELRRRMAAGEPLMVLVKDSKVEKVFPDPIPGMRELGRGSNLVLLTNMP